MTTLPTCTVQPYLRHPLLWALTDVCGLSHARVHELSGVAKTTLSKLDRGAAAADETRVALRRLLKRLLDEMSAAHIDFVRLNPLMSDQTTEYTLWRRTVYNTLSRILDQTLAPERMLVESDVLLLKFLGERGRPRADAIDALRPLDSNSVRRVARRLRVRRVKRSAEDGSIVVWWLPPHTAPVSHSMRQALPRERLKSPRSKQLWRIVEKLFMAAPRTPDGYGWVLVSTIESTTRAAGFSRPLLYRTARKMQIPRKAEGYGASKRAYWSLPAIPPRKTT